MALAYEKRCSMILACNAFRLLRTYYKKVLVHKNGRTFFCTLDAFDIVNPSEAVSRRYPGCYSHDWFGADRHRPG